MSDKTLSNKANNAPPCCCADIGTVIDNTDLSMLVELDFATLKEAEDTLVSLKEKALKASPECVVNSEITQREECYHLEADFIFDCQASLIIFQLSAR